MKIKITTFPRRFASRLPTLRRLALVLGLAWLCAGCAALPGSATPTPENGCLELIPDAELNAQFTTWEELWPIEDCRETQIAARSLVSVGHGSMREVTQILRVEAMPRAAAEEIVRHPDVTVTGGEQLSAVPVWLVILRGRIVGQSLPRPDGEIPTDSVFYGCMYAIVEQNTPYYGGAGSLDCPPHPYIPTPTP